MIGTCLFLGLQVFTATTPTDSGGKLKSAMGQVWVKPVGQSETKAIVGNDVSAGARVRTGPNSNAEIEMLDGSLLRLQPDTTIALSSVKRQQRKTSVLLFLGRVWSKVTRSATGSTSYEINTPNAVAGVRGTEFETAVGDDGSAKVRVTEGKVRVQGEEQNDGDEVDAGEEVEADDEGVDDAAASKGDPEWNNWSAQKNERLKKNTKQVLQHTKEQVNNRKTHVEKLRAEQKDIETKRKSAESRARSGDKAAIDEIRQYNQRLAEIADQIADDGDAASCDFGYVDRLQELASDPRFRGISAKYLKAEAKTLLRLRDQFDAMVREGTDLSIESMDKMLREMGDSKKGTLKDDKGSSVKDLFGDDDLKK